MAYSAELQMLREICWLLLPSHTCEFCQRPLFNRRKGMTFGHRRHPRIEQRLTVHHRDSNRDNNEPANLSLVHKRCHTLYHAGEPMDEEIIIEHGDDQQQYVGEDQNESSSS